ncbi:hypothetical protein RvY_16866 [Ramazzottius varieornatus]|uniref:Nucleolar protein 6 n=1 Tax=Ramazzottius varieornatus TaxID=947166 RepID=A0A1D1W005_RAMVA|nr:hypothetical protein RvY_16866 [Ramazzottius varieornatus]
MKRKPQEDVDTLGTEKQRKREWNVKYDHLFSVVGADAALDSLARSLKTSPALYIEDIVRKAFGKRVTQVEVLATGDEAPPKRKRDAASAITIGLLLNRHEYKDVRELGPEAFTAGAKEFQEFWGDDNVQLRKFHDRPLSEAVIWKASSEAERRSICARIVKQVLKRHAAIDGKLVRYAGNVWDETLQFQKVSFPIKFPKSPTSEEVFQEIFQTYTTLSTDLRNIADLPLNITSVRSVAPALRFTEVFPPLPATFKLNANFVQPFVQSIPVQVVLEGSAKWPENRAAIARLKTAFQLQIAEVLKASNYAAVVTSGSPTVTSGSAGTATTSSTLRGAGSQFLLEVGVEGTRRKGNDLRPTAYHTSATELQVWKNGWCFTLEIVYLGEIQLSRKVTLPDGRTKLEDTLEHNFLKRKFDLDVKLSGALGGFSRQFESFGLTCRLAKRWISSQLLHPYVPPEIVELIVAYVYLHESREELLVSSDLAFVKFLSILSNFDWAKSLMIVNFNDELTSPEVNQLKQEFSLRRKEYPPMCVLTPFDNTSTWSAEGPTSLVLKRLTLLARAAFEASAQLRLGEGVRDAKALFRAPMDDQADCVIHLKKKMVARRHEMLDLVEDLPAEQSVKSEDSKPVKGNARKTNQPVVISMPHLELVDAKSNKPINNILVDFDTVSLYVESLRNTYGNFAYFFVDLHGGYTVHVVWKTAACQPVPFDADRSFGRMVSGDNKAIMSVNVSAMVEDFSLLGRGLVQRVELRSDKWTIV